MLDEERERILKLLRSDDEEMKSLGLVLATHNIKTSEEYTRIYFTVFRCIRDTDVHRDHLNDFLNLGEKLLAPLHPDVKDALWEVQRANWKTCTMDK